MSPSLIDTHCHLDFSVFDEDRGAVIKDAEALGISQFIVPGVSPFSSDASVKMLAKHSAVRLALGLHPWWINRLSEAQRASLDVSFASSWESHPYVAIGECGLDAAIDVDAALQLRIFQFQIEFAKNVNAPLIIHSRKAHPDILRELKSSNFSCGAVIHAFSGSFQQAKDFWSVGCYLGVGGGITYERAVKTRNAIKNIPLEALVLETDSPDMPLSGQQGTRNSPSSVVEVVKYLAQLKGISQDDVMKCTTENAQRLFRLTS